MVASEQVNKSHASTFCESLLLVTKMKSSWVDVTIRGRQGFLNLLDWRQIFFIANWNVIWWLISYIFVYCCFFKINCIEERKFKLLTTFRKCPVTRARSRTGLCLCSFLTRHVMAGATTERPVLLQLHTSITHPRGLTMRLHEVAGFGFVALQNKMLQSGGSVNALYL